MNEPPTESSVHADAVGLHRSARSQRTHTDIHHAALTLAQSRPVSEITVEEIARAAGVSRRTFFNHFPTKNHAFVPDVGTVPPEALERFRSRTTRDMLAAIDELLQARAAALWPVLGERASAMYVKQSNPELQPLLLDAVRSLELRLREAAAHRLGVPEGSPDAAAAAGLIGMVERSSLDLWRHRCQGGDIPSAADLEQFIHTTVIGVRDALKG